MTDISPCHSRARPVVQFHPTPGTNWPAASHINHQKIKAPPDLIVSPMKRKTLWIVELLEIKWKGSQSPGPEKKPGCASCVSTGPGAQNKSNKRWNLGITTCFSYRHPVPHPHPLMSTTVTGMVTDMGGYTYVSSANSNTANIFHPCTGTGTGGGTGGGTGRCMCPPLVAKAAGSRARSVLEEWPGPVQSAPLLPPSPYLPDPIQATNSRLPLKIMQCMAKLWRPIRYVW